MKTRWFVCSRWSGLAAGLLCGVAWLAHGSTPLPHERLRYIIETDAGGDPDDEQSLVRFLLYANEWDVEGIIANRPRARDRENLNPERTGLGIVRRMVTAYGLCYSNLVQHDPRYPKPEQLLQRTVAGTEETDDGVNLIIAAVDRDDPRPVWFSNWGTDRGSAPSCLKRALDRVRRDRGQSGYAKFKEWQGTSHRENSLKRWAVHLQNDFKARMDWCVKPFNAANHPPRIVLNGVGGSEVLRLAADTGAELKLDASASTDPDGHRLNFEWFVYREPGTYRGPVAITGTHAATATLRIPKDAAGHTIHIVVAVTDQGEPPLTRYRRAVITASDAASAWRTIEPFFQPPAEFANQIGPYRSPLRFNDGTRVTTHAEWARRRAEILKQWTDLMGPWPPVIEKPKLEFLSQSRRDNFTQHRVRLEIAPNQTSEGWLLVPEAERPLPAVLVVYYEPETSIGLGKEPLHDFGLQLARRGFVTLSIGTPGGNAWKPEIGAAVCQPLSFHAYIAANCWQALANLPEVDRARIGVVGHSYGGKWAMFAGALWDKFACIAVSDPGIVFDETRPNVNYWEPWYLGLDPQQKRPKAGVPAADNPRTGAYQRMIETGRDLHELHALIAPRPFFVSGGSEDPPARWLALNHAVTLNQLLGQTNRVAMTSRETHAPTEESNRQLYAFFEHFLKHSGFKD
jgi:dienelactone hydrolase